MYFIDNYFTRDYTENKVGKYREFSDKISGFETVKH